MDLFFNGRSGLGACVSETSTRDNGTMYGLVAAEEWGGALQGVHHKTLWFVIFSTSAVDFVFDFVQKTIPYDIFLMSNILFINDKVSVR